MQSQVKVLFQKRILRKNLSKCNKVQILTEFSKSAKLNRLYFFQLYSTSYLVTEFSLNVFTEFAEIGDKNNCHQNGLNLPALV